MGLDTEDYASYSLLRELVARLGGTDLTDKKGTILFADNFESPTLSWTWSTGGNAYWTYDYNLFLSGSRSLKCVTDTDGGVSIMRYYPLPPSKRIGLSLLFGSPSSGTKLSLESWYHEGTVYMHAGVKIHFNTSTVWLTQTGIGDIEILTLEGFNTGISCFYPLKLVVDFAKRKYQRLIIGFEEYDISAYDILYLPYPIYNQLTLAVSVTPQLHIGGSVNIDDSVLTYSEP